MEINEHIVSISGKASTQDPLELGQDYRITIEGTVTSQTDVDNDNGTKNRINKLKPRLIEAIEHKGKKLTIKDKSSTSQRNRARHFVWQGEHPLIDLDYEKAGELIRRHYDLVMEIITSHGR
jgi:hypothetical protein